MYLHLRKQMSHPYALSAAAAAGRKFHRVDQGCSVLHVLALLLRLLLTNWHACRRNVHTKLYNRAASCELACLVCGCVCCICVLCTHWYDNTSADHYTYIRIMILWNCARDDIDY